MFDFIDVLFILLVYFEFPPLIRKRTLPANDFKLTGSNLYFISKQQPAVRSTYLYPPEICTRICTNN